jgi:ABC-2 type transport system permease protein
MDIASITTAYGWLKTEGFVFILLVTGCYASVLGGNILLKEESDKTIEYLASLPVTRKSIVLAKYIVGLIYTICLTVAIGIFNYIGLYLSGDFDTKQYLLLAVTPIFSSVVLYSLCMFVSTFFKKTNKMFGLCIGITFISYFLNAFSAMNESTEALKYMSVYTLSDVRNIITEVEINPVYIGISIGISAIMLLLTLYRYEKKELI